MYFSILVFVFFSINSCKVAGDKCTDFKTCGKCVGNDLNCVWCPDKAVNGSRCQTREFKNKNKNWCKAIMDPVFKANPAVKNEPLSNAARRPVQIRPQKVYFKGRPGDSLTFSVFYKPAKDYPLDVYFLMDNSYTMRLQMEILIAQAKEVHKSLVALTNNVHFGAGSFVEKFAYPFASTVLHTAYPFKNNLPMNGNVSVFVDTVIRVNKTLSTGNYDAQEATFDALMQAMVCEKEIGWRKAAWKMIIVSTDAPYHSAGDGKFVGAYRPNDMKCRLKNSEYDKDYSLLYDYPSVSQINKISQETDIAIIFAVLKQVKTEYVYLSRRIKNSRMVELENTAVNQSKIVETITEQYKILAQGVVMNLVSVPSFVEVTLDPPCDKADDRCKVKHETPFPFEATITLRKCPEKDFKSTFEIGAALLEDKVEVDVEIICECECEKTGVRDWSLCSGNGTYQCGVCACNPGRYGEKCQCAGSSSEELDMEKCKASKGDAQVCSGRGDCVCGQCTNCDNYIGLYCETPKYNCPSPHNEVCGGRDHGICLANGTCTCKDGWTGDSCVCATSNDTCTGPYNTVCNDHGKCVCGKCVCTELSPTGYNYTGPFCNVCEDGCNRCNELGDYVECNYNNDKQSCDQRAGQVFNREVLKLSQSEMKAQYRRAKPCSRTVGDGSTIFFKYIDKQNATLILIQNEKEPAPAANVWVAVGVSIGIVLLIGILTLIAWKVLVDLHDKNEYQRFAQQAASNGFDVAENPLYQPPAVNINNPAYKGQL